MQRLALYLLVAALLFCTSCQMMGSSDKSGMWHQTTLPDQVKWESNPPSLPPGARVAMLEGDFSKPGFYTARAWLPDGYRIPPHWHPGPERVTVLSGTMYLGEGDVFDPSKGTPLPAGSYSSMSAGMHHYAWTKGDTVIQISGVGPWGITYVNSADDPRNAKK